MEKILKILFVVSFVLLVLIVSAYSPDIVQLEFFITIFILNLVLVLYSKLRKQENEYIKLFLIVSAFTFSLRYLYWRTLYTLNFDNIFNALGSLSLYLAEVYSFFVFLLGAFIALRIYDRKSIPIDDIPPEKLPTVDIYIPTYDEPLEVIKPTTLAASVMDYPRDKFNIYILDDGGTEQKRFPDLEKVKKEAEEEIIEKYKKIYMKKYKNWDEEKIIQKIKEDKKDEIKAHQEKEVETAKKKGEAAQKRKKMLEEFAAIAGENVHYLTRKRNEHAKAGNINEALKHTNGDIILILDCDHVPTQNFLRETVGFFIKNPKLFLVQTPHKFYNQDPIEKNLRIFRQVPNENEMFYGFIQKGLDFWDASFFCGSAAMLRRKYLEEVGGIAGDTITEDAETALELHSRGYHSYYYPKGMVFGLQPETFSAFVVQRSRWAQGMIQIFLLKNPLFKKGLKWYQKLGYLNANVFWFFGLARFTFLIVPLFFIFFNLKIYDATLADVISYSLPHFFFSVLLSYYLYSKYRWPFFSEVYESLQSLFLLPAIISVILAPRSPTFIVTPKGENIEKDFVTPFYKPIFFLFNITVIGIMIGIYKYVQNPDQRGTLAVLGFWMCFNILYLGVGMIVAHEKPEKRTFHRIPANDEAIVYINHKAYEGTVRDISLTGIWIEVHKDISHLLKDYVWDKKLKFLIKDEYGIMFAVEGQVVNANAHNIRMKFVFANIDQEKKITQLVYASSSRWKLFMQEKAVSPFYSIMFLFKLIFRDFGRAYIEVVKTFYKDLLGIISFKRT
ncbi:MAG: glycosyltransferase family 2 protein [Nautiliaceae bacterium]